MAAPFLSRSGTGERFEEPEKAECTQPERKLYFAECLYYLPSTAIFFAEIFNYKSHAFPFH
jgi:hypothetical protein